MKPKPFWLLNHFTVPFVIVKAFLELTCTYGPGHALLRPQPRRSILVWCLKRARPSGRSGPVIRPIIEDQIWVCGDAKSRLCPKADFARGSRRSAFHLRSKGSFGSAQSRAVAALPEE